MKQLRPQNLRHSSQYWREQNTSYWLVIIVNWVQLLCAKKRQKLDLIKVFLRGWFALESDQYVSKYNIVCIHVFQTSHRWLSTRVLFRMESQSTREYWKVLRSHGHPKTNQCSSIIQLVMKKFQHPELHSLIVLKRKMSKQLSHRFSMLDWDQIKSESLHLMKVSVHLS